MYKDVSNTIKTAIDYPPKMVSDEVSCVSFFKFGTNYEKIDNFGQVKLLFDINLK